MSRKSGATEPGEKQIQVSNDPSVVQDEFAQIQLYENLGAWVTKKYEACKNDATSIRNQWYINLAMYKGDQYVQLAGGRLVKAPQVEGRIRLVINRIRGVIQTQISRMTSQKPTATVLPASADDDDVMAAEAGEAAWEFISEKHDVQGTLIDAAFWASVCGIGYIKDEWDNSISDVTKVDGKEIPVHGDFKYSAPTPFHIFVPDALERDIEKQPFVMHAFTMSIEEVKAKWPELGDMKPSVVTTNDIMQTQYLNVGSTSEEAKPNACMVIETWVKPGATALLPKGGVVISVDNRVVYLSNDGIPHKHGEYPFAKIDNIPTGGYYSSSPIEDLIPVQKELNRNRSIGVETRNIAAKPQYTVMQGSIDVNKWSTAPGAVIEYKPGFQPPQPMNHPQLPSYVAQEHENLLRDIEDISGQHQVSKGTAPSGVTAATAISFLQEQDESFMYTVYYSIEKAMQKVAHHSLMNAVQYWDEPRLIKSVGTDQPFSARLLSRADLKGGTDIRMDTGSALPVSKSARNALFMDMMNRGLIPADKGLELMELPNMRRYYEIVKVDEKQATRENLKLRLVPVEDIQQAKAIAEQQKAEFLTSNGWVNPETGQPDEMAAMNNIQAAQALDQFNRPIMPVNDWDNHEVHIYTHERFMKSQAFEMLDDLIQQEFVAHVTAHKNIMQSMQLTQLMQGGVSGGDQALEGMPGAMPGGPEGAPEGQPQTGGNPEGANQFSGIEEPVDGMMQ